MHWDGDAADDRQPGGRASRHTGLRNGEEGRRRARTMVGNEPNLAREDGAPPDEQHPHAHVRGANILWRRCKQDGRQRQAEIRMKWRGDASEEQQWRGTPSRQYSRRKKLRGMERMFQARKDMCIQARCTSAGCVIA